MNGCYEPGRTLVCELNGTLRIYRVYHQCISSRPSADIQHVCGGPVWRTALGCHITTRSDPSARMDTTSPQHRFSTWVLRSCFCFCRTVSVINLRETEEPGKENMVPTTWSRTPLTSVQIQGMAGRSLWGLFLLLGRFTQNCQNATTEAESMERNVAPIVCRSFSHLTSIPAFKRHRILPSEQTHTFPCRFQHSKQWHIFY